MKIILATGIYPPDIGGPATYVEALAGEFLRSGHEVVVVTYGEKWKMENGKWKIAFVPRGGGPLMRWWRYAQVLKKEGQNVDVVYAFSSVSTGVPMMLARLRKPKKILRLGGDFFWERYTDRGGMKGLREWYQHLREWKMENGKWKMLRIIMGWILRSFDHIVFSTFFEEDIYEHEYRLPPHSVIENALPQGQPVPHVKHDPFRLLFMGRFVAFKNLPSLLRAVALVSGVRLTLVGEGPMEEELRRLASQILAIDRVMFLPASTGEEKKNFFAEQDLLVIPSITELSPNVALEARSAGLPVLLTQETGLSERLARGMVLQDCSAPEMIAAAVKEIRDSYDFFAREASLPASDRGWGEVAREHLLLFDHL